MVIAGEAETGIPDDKRFAVELEFVQCLANPHYLNWLAQQRFLDDACFLNYLRYLQYWKEEPYVQYIIYPHALKMLDLLQSPEFRAAIVNPAYKEHVHSQQLFFWQHWRTNRLREAAQLKEVLATPAE
ncbi:hypothetical protein ACKKBG_A00990 [Auxenochlorella protothecoides x Auxenochlorella symbiontica]